jgi:ribosomal protein S18 acetylase RimI-like enzyme
VHPQVGGAGYYPDRRGISACGRGLATELGTAVVRYGFTSLHLLQIVAVVRPENRSSQHVLEKLGFEYLRDAHYYGFDVQYWRLRAGDIQSHGSGQPAQAS